MSFEGVQHGPREDRFDNFLEIDHDEDWDGTVKVGIPLYLELKSGGDNEKILQVKGILTRLVHVMKNSGAGSEDRKKALIQKIETALGYTVS